MSTRRILTTTAVGVPLTLLVVLVVEGWLAATGEYLPHDPGYVVDYTAVPGGSGPAGTTGGKGPASEAADLVEMVFLGDSTVAGVGSPTEEESLPALVAQRVADATGRPVHVVGYGVSGARTADVRQSQVPDVLDAQVDVVVVIVGSNDATHTTPFWEMTERTVAMLRAAHDQSDAPVVLGGIPQFRTVPALAQPLRWVVGRYAGVLRERQRQAARQVDAATFVDIAALASPRFLGRPASMSVDGFHPSPLGYGFWADALAPAVVEALE